MKTQQHIDARNGEFWSEPCGTRAAIQLGVVDSSPASLKKFDDWFFAYYDYLEEYIPFEDLASKSVLEVGLGYGSVAQRLMTSGAYYHGLDIAADPVLLAELRASQLGVCSDIRKGSILECPFETNSFDCVVSLGCLHFTGNLSRAIAEVHRVLKPGGTAIIMVYYAFGLRYWLKRPLSTFRRALNGPVTDFPTILNDRDTSTSGREAPEVVEVTRTELRRLMTAFSSVTIRSDNVSFGGLVPRRISQMILPSVWGFDLYATAVK
jgi:SAM-dependent methyltransferase